MLHVTTLSLQEETHPLEEVLQHQLKEAGYTLSELNQANILICMGTDIQGFDEISIAQLEQQIVERFLGAELFLLARAHPFARIRVGLNEHKQYIIACPIDENSIYRIVRLLDQMKRLQIETYEDRMGGFATLPLLTPTSNSQFGSETGTSTEPTSDVPTTPKPSIEDATLHYTPISIQPSLIEHRDSSDTSESTPADTGSNTSMTWQEQLDHWHLRPCNDSFTFPPELSHAGIQQVLRSTTSQQTRQDILGQKYGLFGFPDLVRPTSRVLLIAPDGGIVALHRKQITAVLSPIVEDILFSLKQPFPTWAKDLLQNNIAFALEGTRLYTLTENRVYTQTNAHNQKMEGPVQSTIASLLLHWSTR